MMVLITYDVETVTLAGASAYGEWPRNAKITDNVFKIQYSNAY